MRVQFYSRGPIDQVSGGYYYNRMILDYLQRKGIKVDYHPDTLALARVSPGDTVIVDGLVIPDCLRLLLTVPTSPVLLLHMVPQAARAGGDTFNEPGRDMVELLQRSRIVVSGASTRESLRDSIATERLNMTLIEPGVPFDGTYQRQYARTATRLLCLANYVPGKGHLRMLDALVELQHLDWTLRMHGNLTLDQSSFDAVNQRVTVLGLADRITVGNSIPHADVAATMSEADLLLQWSENESYSIVVAEAIACGLPVLATKTGNWRHFAQSGLVELLVRDDADETATVLAGLIGNEQQYGRLRPVDGWSNRRWDDAGREFHSWLKATA